MLVYDAALAEQPQLVDAAVAAAGLALENARLHAVERAHLARLAEAAIQERRNLERDLHDRMQPSLLHLSRLVDQAREAATAPGGQGPLSGLLDTLAGAVHAANQELRELAQGIHPAILTERGLAVAVGERILRVPIPVLVELPRERYRATVEATAFYVISEALTNTTKHAHATQVTIRGWQQDGRLVVAIRDDGSGGAAPRQRAGGPA